MTQTNPKPRDGDAEKAAIRKEARAAVEAAKRKNLAALRRAVIARLGEAGITG